MMLADLLTTLATQGALKPSRVPAMKTSIKSLAEALGHTSPGECPADWALREEATWGKALEDHWRTLETQGRPAGASMRRNTRNDIRKVFTLAEASGLLTAPLPTRLLPRLSTRQVFLRERSTTAPYKSTYNNQGARRYWLPQAQWPPDITEGFQAYRARCGGRLRETTFQTYVKCLATYLGYHAHIVGHPLTWDEVFDPAHVTAFMRWHAERLGRSSTAHGQLVAIKLTTMAQVLGYRQAEALGALRRELKPPAPLHAKRQHHWVDLDTLETVAETCLAEGRAPYNIQKATRFPGAQRAVGFQRGVLLKLLRRIPLRSRNLREMQLDRHLWKEQTTGHWHLTLPATISKSAAVASRSTSTRSISQPTAPSLSPSSRNGSPCTAPSCRARRLPFVFLTQCGRPFTERSIHQTLSEAVAQRTGQRFYPHLARSIWATEFLLSDKAPDWMTAAVMLGDKVGTVMASYYDLVDQAHHAKASAFLDKKLHAG